MKVIWNPMIIGYEKVVKVINSCKSLDQLQTAKKYFELYIKLFPSIIKLFHCGGYSIIYYNLQEKLIQKEKELL